MNKLMSIISNGLCSGCGACAAMCPTRALTINSRESYYPIFDEARCIGCGICYQVCPGKGYPILKWTREKSNGLIEVNPRHGPVKGYFLGRSTDPKIVLAGSSGGIGTSLLLHMLDEKKVDAVAVPILEDGLPVVKLTEDREEVLRSAGSKYIPIPMMSVIRELRERPRRIAITVTACQMAAYKFAAQIDPQLQQCLKMAIGLYCGNVNEPEHVSMIAATLGINYPNGTKYLGWREGCWPGCAKFEIPDGTHKQKELQPWLNVALPYFALHRCLLCPDRLNWLADVALGDNHVGKTDETVIIVRSERALQLLRSAEGANLITLRSMSEEQKKTLVTCTKLVPAISFIKWKSRKGLPVPVYDWPDPPFSPQVSEMMKSLLVIKYRLWILIRNKRIKAFIMRYPNLLEKTGSFLRAFPYSVPGIRITIRVIRGLKKRFPFKLF